MKMNLSRKRMLPDLITSATVLCITLAGCTGSGNFEQKSIRQWETAEWLLEHPGTEGNPFDLVAEVTFTLEGGSSITTPMFYDGGSSWKFRFTGSEPGTWEFTTESEVPALDGKKGQVAVHGNPDTRANGFITHFGSKWGWQGSERAFVPQYVMGKDLDYYYDLENDMVNENLIEKDIQEFVREHGFTGFHLPVNKMWFDITREGPFENPDIRTYRVLESIITRVHQEGGACFLWMWGSDGPRDHDTGSGPRGVLGAAGNEKDLRNLRYLAARLGPLPGWSIGYGVDTENGTATVEQLDQWKNFLESHMGWDHFIGARVGYDEKGLWALVPRPPRPPSDEHFRSEISDEHTFWLGGDYIGYTSYRPLYDRYVEALNHHPEKPSFEEDRFRLRNLDKWTYKDYNPELTRRGLWHSALAGGVANIWGHLLPDKDHGGSRSYSSGTVDIKHQIKTYSEFFGERFLKEMETFKLEDPVVLGLKTPDLEHLIFYQEQTDKVTLDLSGIPEPLSAVAVDALKEYREIDLGMLEAGTSEWEAPYKSDWAIAVGEFHPPR